ncbi:unnamed protein product [Moneuplotes crassus]|uniref:Phosphoglycerate mutase family protein n=1 Tax=Euplotes crassus TaxID=5936 RepID=A0AAD1XNU1_EUPCR|nr:unnamed protein product [Moneuplotes crassus]
MPAGFEEPQYDMDHIQNSSKVLLVRHANTLFNLAYVKMLHEKGFGKEVCEFLQDESYRDTPLSEFGIEQCNYASKYANQLDIDLVLISPMRRTLQTAHYLLKLHPQKEDIKYVVHPGFRELLYGYSEITENWEHKLNNEYKHYFPNLDTSMMVNQDGTINELFFCQDMQVDLTKQFVNKSQEEIENIIMAYAKKRFPQSPEELDSAYDRVLSMKRYVRDYIQTRCSKSSQKKVLIISHSNTLRFWIGDWSSMSRPYQKFPEDIYWPRNCEFFPDPAFA